MKFIKLCIAHFIAYNVYVKCKLEKNFVLNKELLVLV